MLDAKIMIHSNFKRRFTAAISETPLELKLDLDEFVSFDEVDLSDLATEDADFLIKHGLHRDDHGSILLQAHPSPKVRGAVTNTNDLVLSPALLSKNI